MEEKSKRSNLIDIMKSMMILSVAVFHLIYRHHDSMFDLVVREMIYLSMPLFMFFAGYFSKDIEGSFLAGLGKRLKKVSLPSLIVTLVLLICFGPYYLLMYEDYSMKVWIGDFLQTYLRPELMEKILPEYTGGQLSRNISAVWFIWALSFATIVFFIAIRFTGDKLSNNASKDISEKSSDITAKSIGVTTILLVLGVILYVIIPPLSWSLQLAPLYAGIMMLGTILKKCQVLEKLEKINLGVSSLIMVVAAVIHYAIFRFCGSDDIYKSGLGDKGCITGVFFVIQIFIGGFVLFTLARLIALSKTGEKAFSWIGRHTLVIMLLHTLIGGITADILHTYNKPGPNWFVEPLTAEIVIKSVITFVVGFAGSLGLAAVNDSIKKKIKK